RSHEVGAEQRRGSRGDRTVGRAIVSVRRLRRMGSGSPAAACRPAAPSPARKSLVNTRASRDIPAPMSEEKQVVELVDAGVPADQGLSSLGLLMQLAGNLFAAYAGLLAFWALFALRGTGETLWILMLLGVSVARSLLHRSAGTQLLYG